MQNVLKSKAFISAILALAAIAAVAVIAVNVGRSGENDLQKQLDLGKRYVSELDYENAVIAYEAALAIDPYCLDAYLGLADAYMALGQQDKAVEIMEQARRMLPDSEDVYVRLAQLYAQQNQLSLVVSILEEGIRVTDSDRLREMLREYQAEETPVEMAESNPAGREEEELPADNAGDGEDASLEIGFGQDTGQEDAVPVLTIARNGGEPVAVPVVVPEPEWDPVSYDDPVDWVDYNDEDYSNDDDGGDDGGSDDGDQDSSSENGTPGTDEGNTDSGMDEPESYLTGIMGLVSGVDGQALEGVTVSVYSREGETPSVTSTDGRGYYRQGVSLPGIYQIVLSKEGYVDLSTSVEVWENAFQSISYVMLTTEESRQMASLSGIVLNAVDGRPVDGATVSLWQGYGNASNGGQNAAGNGNHALTGTDGRFSMDEGINAGYYTVEVSKDNYSAYISNEIIKPGANGLNIAISPTIQLWNEYRIVLTWGEAPRDLDSHLICRGNDNYHVYFGNKNSSDRNASLDWDDTTSYGPETVTLKVEEGNSYIYAVHNYSNGGARPGQSAAWNLAHSQARVVVYDGDSVIFAGNVPVNEEGITWEVFRIEDGQLRVTNEVSFSHPSALGNEMNNDRDAGVPVALAASGDEIAGSEEALGSTAAAGDEEAGNEAAPGNMPAAVGEEIPGAGDALESPAAAVDEGTAGNEGTVGNDGMAGEQGTAGTGETAGDGDSPAASGNAGSIGADGSTGVSGNIVPPAMSQSADRP